MVCHIGAGSGNIQLSSGGILDTQCVNMTGYKGCWCRVATRVFTGQWATFDGRIMVTNGGYEPGMADL